MEELAEEDEVECCSGGGEGEGPVVRRSVGEFENGFPSEDGESGPLGEEREEEEGGSMKEEAELDELE